MNYYNEIDTKAAAWLLELIGAGLIPPGEIDTRSITDVKSTELVAFTQCHFFAGIGGWPFALRLAGWPEDRPVWTGSCPCQPYSTAGKRRGARDERDLWGEFYRLIRECKPGVVFGEQVASADVLGKVRGGARQEDGPVWLDRVQTDLETTQYAFGTADLPAACVGAPHIRQRAWWVGYASGERRQQISRRTSENESANGGRAQGDHIATGSEPNGGRVAESEHAERGPVSVNESDGCNGPNTGRKETHGESGACGEVLEMAHTANCDGWPGECEPQAGARADSERRRSASCGSGGRVVDQQQQGLEGHAGNGDQCHESGRQQPHTSGSTPAPGWNGPTVWHPCTNGKTRRIPTTQCGILGVVNGLPEGVDVSWIESAFPLAGKVDGRVMLLRGYGNAIVPQLAAEFIGAYLDTTADQPSR